ncbi:hypothetical protein HGRIS_012791 [Hohenbuehelia grisea]|uniref:Adenylate kinase active site lid domain-containing protein n=1 Tax=Hohenbuehelia grisea TaxID=104357 RepID=A0ABR3ITQ0_9AGAR
MQSLRIARSTPATRAKRRLVAQHPIPSQSIVPPNAIATCSRARTFTASSASRKALPFFLNTFHGASEQADRERDAAGVLRMIMFGKPGAGKGTLSARLVQKYDILTLSTGDLLRQHIAERTPVGLQAEEIVAQGGLLPDELMLKVVTSRLDLIHNRHWILDGFPRTLGQGKLFDAHLKKQGTPLSLVVNLNVPDDVILSRISDRWVHLPSGRVYNLSYNRPKVDGHDDETGEPLTKRPDDNPEVFARRLTQFYASTSPLLAYYDQQASMRNSRGSASKHHPNQHPHQLSLERPLQLKVETLSGTTSDEIWPLLETTVKAAFPTLRERIDVRRKHSLSDALLGWEGPSVRMGERE